ncbi:MAG: sigma-70 family RNA polymerase sigma factor, partial [Planctomycetota bacterium]
MNSAPDPIEDALLILRVQDGDHRAWREIVERWQPLIYAQARRMTGHPEGASDVAQESWLAMVRSIDGLDDPSRFRPWAYRIVANKASDWIRKRQRDRQVIFGQTDPPDVADAAGSQESQKLRPLRRAIRQLPQEHRGLLSMFYIDQMPLTEIAEVLGIPLGTVKSRLYSIRQELKETIERLE